LEGSSLLLFKALLFVEENFSDLKESVLARSEFDDFTDLFDDDFVDCDFVDDDFDGDLFEEQKRREYFERRDSIDFDPAATME